MSAAALSLTRIPALEALADAFATADEEWRVSYWNAAAERLFAIPREEALHVALWDVLPATREPGIRARLASVVATGGRLRIPFPVGEATLPLDASALDGGGVALHFRDAAEQTRLAERYSRLLASMRDGFIAQDQPA